MAKGENSEKGHQGWKTVPLKPAPAPTVDSSALSHLSSAGTQSVAVKPIVRVRMGLDTSHPFPQANSLQKVASVVDAVYKEVDNDGDLASALDVSHRQGAYYANAAAYLGLIAEVSRDPRQWGLTASGILFLESSSGERFEMLSHLLNLIPVATQVEEQMESVSSSEDLSSSTAKRRVDTINAWTEALTADDAEHSFALERDETNLRIPQAAKNAALIRASRLVLAGEKKPEICDRCFLAKSTSGVCGC